MKLKCIKHNNLPFGKLTIGKLYELDEIGEEEYLRDAYVGSYSSYYLKGDDNEYRYYDIECFIDIVEDRNNKLNELRI